MFRPQNNRFAPMKIKNVVADQAPMGGATESPVATPQGASGGMSPLEKFKKRRKFNQDGYERGESRTVDYERNNQAPQQGDQDRRSYMA